MSAWHVLQVRTGSELEIGRTLRADGHEVVAPVAWRPRTVSRRDKRRVWRPVAKLPGYVMASPGMHATASLCAVDGVARVLGRDGAWDCVSASEAARVAAMSEPCPDEEPDAKPLRVWKTGTEATITSGALAGQRIIVRSMRAGRVRGVLNGFPVEINVEHLE